MSSSTEAGATTRPVSTGLAASYLRALRSVRGLIGIVLVAAVVLTSLVGPFLLPYDPYEQSIDALLPAGSGTHLLGTDEVGRDLFARLLAGTRVDLAVTLVAVPIGAVIGCLLGLLPMISGIAGAVAQRVFDVLLGIPGIILGIGIAIMIAPGIWSVGIAIVLVSAPLFGRLTQTSLNGQLPLDYVAAAEVLGYPRGRVMVRHILPNIVDVLVIRMAIEFAHGITLEGGLSVVGLGIQSPEASLGSMIKSGSPYLLTHPTYALMPVLVVVMLVMGYTLIADALNRSALRS